MTIDGGYGWVIVAVCFLSVAFGDSFIFTYGALYSDLIDLYDESISNVMIGGFLMMGFSNAVGPVGAALVNKFGFKLVMVFGSITSSIAICGSSFINSIFWFNIVMGFIGGTTEGLVLLGAYTMSPLWFEKKRSIACAIAYSGVGFGCIVYPIIIDHLISIYSIRGCILIIGAINLNQVAFSLLVKEPHSLGKIQEIIVQDKELNNELVYHSGEIFIPESPVTYNSNHRIDFSQNHTSNIIDHNDVPRRGNSLTTLYVTIPLSEIKKIKSVIVSVTHNNEESQCRDDTVIETSAFLKILEKTSKVLSQQLKNENFSKSLMSLRSQMSDREVKKFEKDLAKEITKPFLKSNLSILNSRHCASKDLTPEVHITECDVTSPILGFIFRVFQPKLFTNISFLIILCSAFLLTIILFAIPQTMRNYIDAIGFSRQQSSSFSITYGAITIVSKIAIGITERYLKKSKIVFVTSGIVLAITTSLIGLIPNYPYIIFYSVILATATSNTVLMRYVITAEYIPKKYLTSAYGWTFLLQSTTLIPALFIAEIGTEYGNYILSFMVNGLLVLLGSVVILFLYLRKPDNGTE